MNKKILCLLRCFALVAAAPVVASANGEVTSQRVVIASGEQLVALAESCRMDTYSQGLQVVLTRDIDMTGLDFSGIPTFSGVFLGRGHTISGVKISADGSYMGLFRYLTETAVVRELRVEGEVTPGGSGAYAGGIAGSNAGRLEACSFIGTVIGSEYTGGLVGVNTVTGVVENCSASGAVSGNHFVGGMAGENMGVVRGCENEALVNATAADNTLNISDITLESITGTESAATATDIGGIVGQNIGVIRACKNLSQVGYQQMGYNVGGIAGSNVGYIVECENHGAVHGRKEVGGIVGQMVPATQIQFDVDTLQVLEGQLDTLGGIAGAAGFHAQSGVAGVTSQVGSLKGHMDNAKDALGTLLPKDDPDSILPDLPDKDTITAAQNTLSESVKGMETSARDIASGVQSTMNALSGDIKALSGQIGAISQTVKNAGENLGGSLTDISDQDTEEDTTGKLTGCVNYGDVLGDRNVGGIVGAMALENELDQEDNLEILGDTSLNMEGYLRIVVVDSRNHGAVTCKKQCAGGIVGRQTLGLVRGCDNTGKLDGEAADYVGGIAGQSAAIIRSCNAKCELSGAGWVGGIAGSGATVTDCRSMTLFQTVTEKMGHVLGGKTEAFANGAGEILGNLYLSVGKDYGAIDGISYEGCAEPKSQTAFTHLDGIDHIFKTVTVYFIPEEGQMQTVSLKPGQGLDASQIPNLPEKDGYNAAWEGLEEADLGSISFDTVFRGSYTKQVDTVESEVLREGTKAVLLAQGQFTLDAPLEITDLLATYDPSILDKDVLEVWSITVPEHAEIHTLRYCLPNGVSPEEVVLYVKDETTEDYRLAEFRVNGSYLVFSGEGVSQICLQYAQADNTLWYMIGGAAVLAAALVVAIGLIARKKRKAATLETV